MLRVEKQVVGIIESPEQWQQIRELGDYIAKARSARVKGTHKLRVSPFFTNSPQDVRREMGSSA